jgi:hypothetical protein
MFKLLKIGLEELQCFLKILMLSAIMLISKVGKKKKIKDQSRPSLILLGLYIKKKT